MSLFKKLLIYFIAVSTLALSTLLLSSCNDTVSEGGIVYLGTTAVGADSEEESLTIRDGTTIISEGAFKNNTTLKSLKIPSSVHTIEAGAFSGATSLIKTEDGISYVDNWVIGASDELTDITLREGTIGIATEALSSLPSLKSLTIPDSVKYINARAIYGADSLEQITLPFIGSAYNSTYSMYFGYIFGAFSHERNADYVPESLKSVTITGSERLFENAFLGCSMIESINLPTTLKKIDGHAFDGCSALSGIVIPDSVTAIGERAFMNCYSLESVRLPNNKDFKVIEQFSFAYCKSLKNIEIPQSVDSIRACAFAVCEAIESVTLPNKTLDAIGQQAFNGCKKLTEISVSAKLIERGAFRQCKRLVSVNVSDGCEEILGYAFEDCTEVKRITLPESVNYLGESVFKGCSLLETVNIPCSIEIIEAQSFLNCSSLTSLKIPDSVKTIVDTAFDGAPARIEEVISGVTYIDGWITHVDASLNALTLSADIRGIANNVFDDCRGLSNIHFEGSASEWLALTENSVNPQLQNVTMSYGKIE